MSGQSGGDTADSVTVSGQVTDGSGHGWALYAEVGVAGTGVSSYTDPMTGMFSLSLPAQASYTLQVAAQYPGYAGHTEEIAVGDDDLTVDASLTVDNCHAAPGYGFDGTVGIIGDFQDQLTDFLDSRGIPAHETTFIDDPADFDAIIVNRPPLPGQAVFQDFLDATDAAGTGVVFLDNWSVGGIRMLWQYTDLVGTRLTDSDATIPHLFYEVIEEHPILDGFQAGEQIEFEGSSDFRTHAWFDGYAGDVIAYAGRSDTGVQGPGIGVQERDNNRHALLSMHGVESFVNPSHWTDEAGDIFANSLEWVGHGASFECFMVDGGLVLGQVEDMNTGEGISGATVTSVGEPGDSGRSSETPDDPALGDGFYWLFSSLTGSQDFTASANKYVDVAETVDVAVSDVTGADLALPAGQLEIEPAEVEATVEYGGSAERSVTITNTGTAPAEVELRERRGDFEMLGVSARPSGSLEWLQRPTETVTVESNAPGVSEARPSAARWIPSSPAPQQAEILLYADDSYHPAPSTHADVALQELGLEYTAFYDGNFALFQQALAQQDWDLVLFAHENFDPPASLFEDLNAYVEDGGKLAIHSWYVAVRANDPLWETLGIEWVTWDTDPPSPLFWWEADHSAFIEPRSVPEFTELEESRYGVYGHFVKPIDGAEALGGYTEEASENEAALVLHNDKRTVFRGFADGHNDADLDGDGILDGVELWMNLIVGIQEGFDVDVPWLEISPLTATLQPGESVTVTVSMDSSAEGVDQPGAYTAGIGILHNTPHAVDPVDMTMNVEPSHHWGKIVGTVTGVDCIGETVALAGAQVQIRGSGPTSDAVVELRTGPDGAYGWWMDARGRQDVTVSKDGYVPQSRATNLRRGGTTVENFTLVRLC